MASNRPATLIRWVSDDNSPNLAQPPAPLVASGYAPGEPLIAQHHNAVLHNITGWLGYLSQAQTAASQVAASNQAMRLLGGGTLTYAAATTTLAWSAPFTIAIPSAADADNQLAAGSVAIPAGSVAYVQANIPITTQADYASGATALQNVASTAGLAAGMLVSGPSIPTGTTVTDVQDGQVTISQATTGARSQASVSFATFGPLTVQVADSQALVPAPNTVIVARGTGAAVSVGIGQTELWLRDQEARSLVSQGYGATMTAPAGQALAANQAVYLSAGQSDARTQGSLYPADAGATNSSTRGACVGFTHTATAQGDTAHVVQSGLLQGFSGLTQGAIYYLDPNTPGGVTTAMTTTLGQALMSVGVAISGTALLISLGRSQTVTNTFPNGAKVTGTLTADALAVGRGLKQTLEMGDLGLTSNAANTYYQTQRVVYDPGTQTFKSAPFWRPVPYDGSILCLAVNLIIPSGPINNTYALQLKARARTNATSERIVYTGVNLVPSGNGTGQSTILIYFKKGDLPFFAGDLLSLSIFYTGTTGIQAFASLTVEMTSLA